MRNATSIVGALLAVALPVGGRIAALYFLKTHPLPTVQFTMPTGAPVPTFEPTALRSAIGPSPFPFPFPTPGQVLGPGGRPRSRAPADAEREASRPAPRAPYSPGKSLRGSARPGSSPCRPAAAGHVSSASVR